MPSDLAILEEGEARKDLPCTVTDKKPDLGFDLRFHAGYDVAVPMKELSGDGNRLTIVFRIYPEADKSHVSYFVQHVNVPTIDEDAKGDAILQGMLDLGQGKYHVDWMMRDRAERLCSESWDVDASLGAKDRSFPLFLNPNDIAQYQTEPFVNEAFVRPAPPLDQNLNLKLLVNFAPQLQGGTELKRTDIDALLTILRAVERDPHVRSISLVAFNINEAKVVYRQDAADAIDYPALGKALHQMELGTVDVGRLGQKHSETDFLEDLIVNEVGAGKRPDAVIFAGPKAMLNADVPQEELRRIGNVECPVFYLNYNLNPQAVPWKDSISHAIRVFKGTEFTISRPRDLWSSTTEMFGRILRIKHEHPIASSNGLVGAQSLR